MILAKRRTPFATNSLTMLSFLAKFREVFVEKSYWRTCLPIIFHPWMERYLQKMSGKIELDIFYSSQNTCSILNSPSQCISPWQPCGCLNARIHLPQRLLLPCGLFHFGWQTSVPCCSSNNTCTNSRAPEQRIPPE